MKRLLKKSLLALLIPLVYFICASGFNEFKEAGKVTPNTPATNYTFTNAIFNTGYNIMLDKPWLKLLVNLDNYKSLNFNAIQWYDWAGSDEYGNNDHNLMTPSQYNAFNSVITAANNKGLLGFYERSFISGYCYGQRLIYEVAQNNGNQTLNYGFVYKTRERGNYELDGDRTVVHAVPATYPMGGYLCKDIHENLQHTDLLNFRSDDKGLWHIKPVMKIPVNTPPNTNVVRIEIMAFDNKDPNQPQNQVPIKEVTIKAENFMNKGAYNIEYLGLNPDLTIDGKNSTDTCLSKGITEDWWNWDEQCHVDFRVYWYGQCEVWFDKMIVDDSKADELFKTENQNLYIKPRIQQEMEKFATTPGNYCFFVDEVTNSNIPCMRYVFEQMRTPPNANVNISFAFTDVIHNLSLKNDNLPYTVFYDSLQPNFVQHDAHKFEIWETDLQGMNALKLPNTITEYDDRLKEEFFTNVEDYNNRLQTQAFGYKTEVVNNKNEMGSLLYEIYKVYNSKPQGMGDVKFIMQPQIHGYLKQYSGNSKYAGGLREPTNEEIQAQAMISLAHGADGLCWYIYGSEEEQKSGNTESVNGYEAMHIGLSNQNYTLYTYGLLDKEIVSNIGIPRHENCYYQDKWTYVSAMNGKINNWMNLLNNTDWAGGYSVHQEGANNKCVENIKSIYRNPQSPYSFSISNDDVVKYWEEGFYTPKDLTDRSKYLLMVNRRCVPETTPGVGDIRQLKIKFKASDLEHFNNWILEDVNTGQQITFNKNNQGTDGYLNLGSNQGDIGYFLPGEGKLFKLAPVMQEGGTFVCNEQVINTSFVCKSPVFTGGYKLEILSQNSNQMEILFKQGAKINCEIGNAVLIYGSQNNHLKLKGFGSDKWNGIEANNLADFKIQYVDFENIAQGWTVSSFNCVFSHIESCFFNAASDGVKAININNSVNSNAGIAVIYNQIFIKNCYYAIFLGGAASTSNALFFYGNTVNSSELSQVGILMSNIMSVYVSDNNVNGFKTGFKLMECTLDLTNNSISGSGTDFVGINAVSSSTVNMGLIGANYRGWGNSIYTSGSNGNNILLNNSVFNMDYGNNDFNVDAGNGSYNMYGNGNFVTNDDGPQKYIEAKGN